MAKRKILIQLDSDPQPSVFDRVVAVDAGADEIFSYGGVTPENMQEVVHGSIFTRGGDDLKCTALFIGGSNAATGEKLLEEALKHMLPQYGLRVSVLLDASGANTTAAAAVRAASRHMDLQKGSAIVLGGTGPVGQRVARLLARQGADVRVASRLYSRAARVCETIRSKVKGARVEPIGAGTEEELREAVSGRSLAVAAGAAGVVLLPKEVRLASGSLRVAIDLNAVPPLGIEGVETHDKGVERDGVICYGAIGVGGAKMKIHRAAVAKLFERNDHVLDAEEVYEIALSF